MDPGNINRLRRGYSSPDGIRLHNWQPRILPPFILTSRAPASTATDGVWTPRFNRPTTIIVEPSYADIGTAFGIFQPPGSRSGIFSYYTTPESVAWLGTADQAELLARLNKHEVTVTICIPEDGPVRILIPYTIKLRGDATFLISAEMQVRHHMVGQSLDQFDGVNRLLAAGLSKLVRQFQNPQIPEPLRRHLSFFDEDRTPDLTAHVILRTRLQPGADAKGSLRLMMDLLARVFEAHIDRQASLGSGPPDQAQIIDVARGSTQAVPDAVRKLAVRMHERDLLPGVAMIRMLAIGDMMVPTALYQTCARLENKYARQNTLVREVVTLVAGSAVKAGLNLLLGASVGGGLVDELSNAFVDHVMPVPHLTENTEHHVINYTRDIEWYANEISGLAASDDEERAFNQQKAESLRDYSAGLLSTWNIAASRLDSVGDDMRAVRHNADAVLTTQQRTRSLSDTVLDFFRRR